MTKPDLPIQRAAVQTSQVWHGRFGDMLIETCVDGSVWIDGEVVRETLPRQSWHGGGGDRQATAERV